MKKKQNRFLTDSALILSDNLYLVKVINFAMLGSNSIASPL